MLRSLERLSAIEFGPEGKVFHPTMLNPEQKELFKALEIKEPPKLLNFSNFPHNICRYTPIFLPTQKARMDAPFCARVSTYCRT